MPLAIYTYVRRRGRADELRRRAASAYYPFCDYSPGAGGAARRPQAAGSRRASSTSTSPSRRCSADRRGRARRRAVAARRAALRAQPRACRLLAERLGCRDHEDLWERLFEADAADRALDASTSPGWRRTAGSPGATTPTTTCAPTAPWQREAEMACHVRAGARRRGSPATGRCSSCSAASTPWCCRTCWPDRRTAARAIPHRRSTRRRGADPVHLRPARPAQRLRRRHDLARRGTSCSGST